MGRPNVTPESVALTASLEPRKGDPETKGRHKFQPSCKFILQTYIKSLNESHGNVRSTAYQRQNRHEYGCPATGYTF